MTIEIIKTKLKSELDSARESLNANLGRLSDMADRPLTTAMPNMEGAVQVRMRELDRIINEQHSRLRTISSLKWTLRQIEREERKQQSKETNAPESQ